MVQRQLYHYLSSNHLLSGNQHGFRPHHSTETALVTAADHILTAADSGEISLMCLIDLSKCFDVIDHDVLLSKLCMYGIDTQWFATYLSGHTQSVSLRDGNGAERVSPPLPNSMGVFQGSAFGPLLFSVFANDLSLYAADARVLQFGDDTQVLVSGQRNELPALISSLENSGCLVLASSISGCLVQCECTQGQREQNPTDCLWKPPKSAQPTKF